MLARQTILQVSQAAISTRCEKSHTCPKIIHTDSESEIWSSGGSLVVTDTKGARDVKLPKNVRTYLFTGAKHGPGGSIDPGFVPAAREPSGLQAAFQGGPHAPRQMGDIKAWSLPPVVIRTFQRDPGSRRQNLISRRYRPSAMTNTPFRLLTTTPCFSVHIGLTTLSCLRRIVGEYPVYAMKVDKDGNGVDGVRLPDITVPVATYTGWNRIQTRLWR